MPAVRKGWYHSLTPRIFVSDVAAQAGFLRSVFGATGTVEQGQPAELIIGDSLIMISPDTGRPAFPAFLYVYVDDPDQVFERAVAAGAVVIDAPLDTPYSDRRATVRDPFGNVFQIAHQISGRSPAPAGSPA